MRESQPAEAPEIVLLNPNRYPDVVPSELGPWLARLVAEVRGGASGVAVRFLGDRAMRGLNSRFRGRAETTDVLSFPGDDDLEGMHLGDIAISVPVARRQAAERGHPVDRELRCLLLHGVLHCLGHDHETDGGEMRRLELRLRRRWVDQGTVAT